MSTCSNTPKEFNEKQRRIVTYLCENAEEQTYFKSRCIAEAVGLSAKEVGANIARIVDTDGADELRIEKWGYSSGTTWMVTTEGTA